MSFVKEWLEGSPYNRTLGVEQVSLSDDLLVLRLPFNEANTNPGGALHGGVAASLSVIGGQGVVRAALGAESGPWHTAGAQINYLAAAINEGVMARARLLRKGKELCFVDVAIETEAGKPIAQANLAMRGRFGAAAPQLRRASGDDGLMEPGPMGSHIGAISFIGNRGIKVELMKAGRSRLVMPYREDNGDLYGVHEGAAMALFDTTGAMAAWAETGPGPYKASTPAIQLQMLAPPPKADLVAYGRVVQRDNELFWSEVEVAEQQSGLVCLRGTVFYRIVT